MGALNHPPVVFSARAGRRAALASTVGAVVDWYDFFLYGTAAAVVFGPLFFPSDNQVAGLLASMGSFAVGFLFRPHRRGHLRPLRRQVRPPHHALHHRHHDGTGQHRHRVAPQLRRDRRRRTHPARDPAGHPRHRRRRRMGRRGPDGSGKRAGRQTQLPRHRRADRLLRRTAARHRSVLPGHRPDHRRNSSSPGAGACRS